jgi:3-hydroxyisobutyrate dehydrogenase-like beta-hydroxyacid dehydrogenase
MRVALLHPGEMGAAIGRILGDRAHDVRWASEGRGTATAARAERFADDHTVARATRGTDLVVSVCPPDAAVAVARSVAAAGFRGTYLDANAIAPATAREIAALVAPASFVDGGIVGGPPVRLGTTRLYVSGAGAKQVAGLFDGSALAAVAIAGPAGAASALKCCYAAYTKGTTALLLAIRALASAEGVDAALLDEWKGSQPGVGERSEAAGGGSARKAWRFAGEMDEIAAALGAAGLPDGFLRSAAEVYRRLEGFKDETDAPSIDALIAAVRRAPG